MPEAHFRFYEELNDFLPVDRRRQEFRVFFEETRSVKHLIESVGVPHTEVEIILANGESVGFDYLVRDGDFVSVYPVFELLDVRSLVRVRDAPLRDTRFLADAHLAGLARRLRMAGFDTVVADAEADAALVRRAVAEGRILLTRDLELLKHRELTHGLYVRAMKPLEQFREVLLRLDLAASMRPFTRCTVCNGAVDDVEAAAVADRVPDAVRARHARFARCGGCGRVYWEGSHWRRMREVLARAASA
ncbi:MAG: Mut7-C ubiquitin/RNAse domain-containing protein [Gammaproteobacteria bacterium]|nr:Mut7-C ubiquitin/RNAse domain-containing protein [Gammaproteobacteria bacterium]